MRSPAANSRVSVCSIWQAHDLVANSGGSWMFKQDTTGSFNLEELHRQSSALQSHYCNNIAGPWVGQDRSSGPNAEGLQLVAAVAPASLLLLWNTERIAQAKQVGNGRLSLLEAYQNFCHSFVFDFYLKKYKIQQDIGNEQAEVARKAWCDAPSVGLVQQIFQETVGKSLRF
ncbi:unnamed protein product [Amoebophrya sp. A25]|nr:unnamed protein product [Amoebophrya sp. A25]|eukprot:GSA25T00024030001.1